MLTDAAADAAAALVRQARLGDVEPCRVILDLVLAKPEKIEPGG